MAMTKFQKKALDLTLVKLSEDLGVVPAIIYLKSKEVFTDNDEDAINAKTTQKEKVLEFVKLLKQRGSYAFDVFQNYLKNFRGSSHLADELEGHLPSSGKKKLKRLKTEITGEREKMEAWQALEEKFYNINCKYQIPEDYANIPNELNFVLIGKTGSGKSSTGNTILGKAAFHESRNSMSETKTIKAEKVMEGNKVITVVDTPGLFDTESDFTNEDLVLELVKTMIDLRKGIHLFLLVCSSNMTFTKEEEQTIKTVEDILTEDVYKNCVVILSNAYSQFGCKDLTIARYIEEEKSAGGKFSDVIHRVSDRVIAVENYLPNQLLKSHHRQKFLCVLMQLVSDNNGSCYSNKLFELANDKVAREENERRSRIRRQEELVKMKKDLGTFLLENYLPSLSVEDLSDEQLLKVLESNIDCIMLQSMVKQLTHVKEEDVKIFLKEFLDSKRQMIENFLAMKLQEKSQEHEIQKKNLEIKQKEDHFKMQSYLLKEVAGYLRTLPRAELQIIQKEKQLSPTKFAEIMEGIYEKEISVGQAEVEHFIKQTFFATQNEIERFINDKLLEENLTEQAKRTRELESDHSDQKLNQKLYKEIPNLVEKSSDTDLKTLKHCLERRNLEDSKEIILSFAKTFSKDLPRYQQKNDSDMSDFICTYFSNNAEFVMGIVASTLYMRTTKREMEEQITRTKALNEISDIIKLELKDFLRGKEPKDLRAMEEQIKQNEVPSEILKTVRKELESKDLDLLDNRTVEIEILKQLEEQKHIIDEVRENYESCFAGDNFVLTKDKGLINISNVEVHDDVLAIDSSGHLFYDKVYLMSHANRKEETTFIKICTKNNKFLLISPNHFLPINGLSNNVPAKEANVGDRIFSLKDGAITQDVIISVSYQTCKGAFCPMTMNGTIVVNDVAASCFTTFLSPRLAQAFLSPLRIMCKCLPKSVFNAILPYEPVEGMPVVLAKCRSVIMFIRSSIKLLKESLS